MHTFPLEDKDNSQDEEITTYFTNMIKMNVITYSEYLHISHVIKETNGENRFQDIRVNLSDFHLEPRSLSHVLRLSPYINETWEEVMCLELVGLFDGDTSSLIDKPLPADEIIPTKTSLQNSIEQLWRP